MNAEEIELVKRVQAGDAQAFDELYQTYYPRAVALAYRFTNDHADAEDVVQETFLQVHKSIHALQEPSHFYSWLNRIIHSKCVNMFYRNRNENAVDPAKMEAVKTYEEKRRYMLPQKESAYIGEQEVLQSILSQMKDIYREVLELAYFEQMKLEEIAEFLDLPLGTVKTRCRRAKEELKKLIDQFEQAEGRRISFDVNGLLPGIAVFSFARFAHICKQRVSNFFIGPAVNAAVITSLSVLAVSGTVMAVQDWTQNQNAPYQNETDNTNQEQQTSSKADQKLSSKAFGNYSYHDIDITTSREAYYVCINWASTLAEMQDKDQAERESIRIIYEAIKNADDQYYQMLKDRGWEADFLSAAD